VIKIKFTKKEEEIINNYLNSGKTDQILKNAQMVGVIYTMLDRIERLEKKVKEMEGDIKCCQLEMTFCQCRPKDEAETK
jgi:hypothetical protein